MHTDGYPAVAEFISKDPDGETYLFRRFANLAARKLLHLESELIELERKQDELDREAAMSTDPDLRSSIRSWNLLAKNAKIRPEESERLQLANEIDIQLARYHEALIVQSRVARLEKPSQAAVKACRAMLLGRDRDDAKLGGNAQRMFNEEFEDDLVALAPSTAKDVLTEYLRQHWIIRKNKESTSTTQDYPDILYFSAQSLVLLANICAVSMAALLLIGPIIVLYFVTDPDARLGLVVAFIILFAVGLSVSTGATRDTIFAATAAYTAVLVVFVSGDLGNARLEGKGP